MDAWLLLNVEKKCYQVNFNEIKVTRSIYTESIYFYRNTLYLPRMSLNLCLFTVKNIYRVAVVDTIGFTL